ncbi:MAG: hypothetical protein J7578_17010 [Chitinophagaceae bacterium]|nr:hypothetical protein [Chitinophagaceae bacterium]
MRLTSTLLVITSFVFTGCISRSYFQSPMHGNTSTYKAIPLHNDSVRSALYAGGHFLAGGTNQDLRDSYIGATGTLHQAHNFGTFQAYYGINATAGRYQVKSTFDEGNRRELNFGTTERFFGSAGANGGINAVLPFDDGEWRVFGTEFSYTREFGDYYKFRKDLPDSAVSYVNRKYNYFTLGFNTEIAGQLRNKNVLTYKIAYILSLNPLRNEFNSDGRLHPAYLSNTISYTAKKITGNIQLNTGTKLFGFQLGLNCRLSRL